MLSFAPTITLRQPGEAGRPKSKLALDLSGLDLSGNDDDLDAGFRSWRGGGSTKNARELRSKAVPEVKKALPSLRVQLRRGHFAFGLPTPTTLKGGRVVAALSAIETILVAALVVPFHRHPALTKILPRSFAYAPPERGARRLVVQLLGAVMTAAAGGAVVEVGAFDVVNCFPSLSATVALAHARALGFSKWRCDALEALYCWWSTVPAFTGLTPGPSSSCFLAELALRPMDVLLAVVATLFRYSDNLYVIGGGGPVRDTVMQCLAAFNESEGLKLSLHHEQLTTYSKVKGFADEYEALGFLMKGHEVVPHQSRVERARKKVIEAVTHTKAGDIIEGFASYYGGPVQQTVLVPVVKELWRARSESRRERKST